MSLEYFLSDLWAFYTTMNPKAKEIFSWFERKGEKVQNDHIAFRTWNAKGIELECLAQFFLDYGYDEKDTYEFTQRKLRAKYYQYPAPGFPKIFISELQTHQCSDFLQATLEGCYSSVHEAVDTNEFMLCMGRCWEAIDYKIYQSLLEESEYAAWLYVYGFMPNHFTIDVNALKTFSNLSEVNQFLLDKDVVLNDHDGLIKGDKTDGLRQSSTMAELHQVHFQNGDYEIPCCYIEFAERFVRHGETALYQGFVPKSADKLFESTDANS